MSEVAAMALYRKEQARVKVLRRDIARLKKLAVHAQATVEQDSFFRWHDKVGQCGECHRKGLVRPDDRHSWAFEQWQECANGIIDEAMKASR